MPSVGVSLRDVNPIPLALKSVLILNDASLLFVSSTVMCPPRCLRTNLSSNKLPLLPTP
ncbi:hypothetical protein LINPERPRIM_LOCUS1985, partial [Linum perenne]